MILLQKIYGKIVPDKVDNIQVYYIQYQIFNVNRNVLS